MKNGKISFSSKVIPVTESIETQQWILPTEHAMEILRKAKSVAVQECECRKHYKRCDNPTEVCFLLNSVGDKLVSEKQARHVHLSEAAEILKKANESGLVHLCLYMPDHEIYALCSCCSCCCHDLQIIMKTNRKDLGCVSKKAICIRMSVNPAQLCYAPCKIGRLFYEARALLAGPTAILGAKSFFGNTP